MVKFEENIIAPCGINCGSCIAFLRQKNRCNGCRNVLPELKTRVKCRIKNCEELKTSKSGFCYDCGNFPCKRLKDLDKRYRTKYNTFVINDLSMIRDKGIAQYLIFEATRRTCPKCGSILSLHRTNCLSCAYTTNTNKSQQ
jgi:ribosomal protein S27AE